MAKKPYKGEISNWNKVQVEPANSEHLGFVIRGRPSGHPDFVDFIRTSFVVSHNEDTGEIETLYSRYKLLNEAKPGEELPLRA